MRFSDFAATLTPAHHTALVNNIIVGHGRLILALRHQRGAPRSQQMLGLLATAYAGLHDALGILTDSTTPAPHLPPLSPSAHALPRAWDDLVLPEQQTSLRCLILVAAEMTRDVAAEMTADAPVERIRDLLRDALHMLHEIRADTLGASAHWRNSAAAR